MYSDLPKQGVGRIGYNLFYGDENLKGDYLFNGGLCYSTVLSLDFFRN